jgi:hypothetical protein
LVPKLQQIPQIHALPVHFDHGALCVVKRLPQFSIFFIHRVAAGHWDVDRHGTSTLKVASKYADNGDPVAHDFSVS